LPLIQRDALAPDIRGKSGAELLDQALELGPRGISRLSCEDFFWLVRKIGPDDCIPLLELASTEQWQYLLDLELWGGDMPRVERISFWIERFQRADPVRLTRWLFTEGELLAHYHLYKSLDVVMDVGDEGAPKGEGFFTLDGVFHIRVRDPRYRESLESLIRTMAEVDLNRYQALMTGLSAVLPAELEEELYRLRNARLAEHGFLPYEEAVSIYSPLEPAFLKRMEGATADPVVRDPQAPVTIPTIPLLLGGAGNLFLQAAMGVDDPLFADRLRLEFAGLANQLLAADGLQSPDTDDLIASCRRGARILNLGLEILSGRDPAAGRRLLERYPLTSVFRVAYGMVLKVKREAERWEAGSWFRARGLDVTFWAERWGGTLEGLLKRRPLFFTGQEDEQMRDFEWLGEVRQCTRILRRLMVVDGLLEVLARSCPPGQDGIAPLEDTYDRLLVTYWGRMSLGLGPTFEGLTVEQARDLLARLRSREGSPPYTMEAFGSNFVRDLCGCLPTPDPETEALLKETLGSVWEAFCDEYSRIPLDRLDGRYSRTLRIIHSRT